MKKSETIERLRIYRLENDLTFGELAEAISALGKPLALRALYNAMTQKDTHPRETTFYKLERFVRHLDANGNGHGAKKTRRPRRRKAA